MANKTELVFYSRAFLMGPEEMEQHYDFEDGSALKHNSRISLSLLHVAFKSLL